MDVHFNDTRPAAAPADTLFAAVTDYAAYPEFNSALVHVEVVHRDEHGAEFVADRKTKIGKRVRAYDRYERRGDDLVVERRYEGNETARSTWTIHPIEDGRSTLNIDAVQSMSWLKGVVMKPLLRHLFYGINFTPFVKEAERRAQAAASRQCHGSAATPNALPVG
jgi:ribosome-associated toxin RatA of RatAB toxin-antitoxin module